MEPGFRCFAPANGLARNHNIMQELPLPLDLNIIYILLGIYGYVVLSLWKTRKKQPTLGSRWEYILSLDIEYAIIRGRTTFRWSMVSSRDQSISSFNLIEQRLRSHTFLGEQVSSYISFHCKYCGTLVAGEEHAHFHAQCSWENVTRLS